MPIKTVLILFIILAANAITTAQTDPFTGSEKIIKKNFNFHNFSSISLIDIDGSTEIVVGDSFKIELKIREKYLPILFVTESDNKLEIKFNYTRENNKYIADPRISIKITCPKLDDLYKQGNSSVSVNVKKQVTFNMFNEGNGNASLKGAVNVLNIKNDGNGKLDAGKLIAENIKVDSFGNGDVIINASGRAIGKRNGNGLIIQKGKAMLKLD